MYKAILVVLILAFKTICYGQSSQTFYYQSEWLGKEVPQKKAKFSKTVTQNADGTVTTDIKNLNNNEIVQSKTFKGNEPYGIWKFRYGNGFKVIDYDFPLIYSNEKCTDNLHLGIKDFLKDNDSLGYKAPKLPAHEPTIYQYLNRNLIYPENAKRNGIQGTVYLQLTLTPEGVEEVVVRRGVDISLDKEAARVLRELKFSSPLTIKGESVHLNCLSIPIVFRLM